MQLIQDLRYGLRSLLHGRTFTAIALGSLALGIGGSTAMYSVIYGVILDPFPYRDPDRLVSVGYQAPNQRFANSYYPIDHFVELAAPSNVFVGVIASTISDVTWTGDGDPQRLRGNHCTMNTFDIMGVAPLIGRTTVASDALPGAEPVTVLGYKFWQRQFGGSPDVLGRRLLLNGKARTVVGVMPPRFMWRGADVYLPLVFHRGETPEGVQAVHALARLKPGVTVAQAAAVVRPTIEELARRSPKDFPAAWRVSLPTFKESFPSGIADALWILFGAVGLLLLIACVNVSNLLLSKAAWRRREIAIRASLGASRSRLVAQLLAESLLLGVSGGVLGIAVAAAGLRGIIAMVPPNTIPDEAQISLNGSVLAFTVAVSVAAALVFGLAPALHMSGGDIVTPLRESGRGVSGGRRQRWLRSLLVVGEVALSVMLLVGASLMIRTLASVQGLRLGMQTGHVLVLRIPFSRERYPDAARRFAFVEEILRRVEAIPGVAAAAVNQGLHPLGAPGASVEVVGSASQDTRPILLQPTSPNYLKTLSIALAEGRFFNAQEVNARAHLAVVNQTFVRRYLPEGGAPLGRLIRIPSLRRPPAGLADDSFQIAGVVQDVVNRISNNETLPEVYFPYSLTGSADELAVRSETRPESIERAVRAQIYAIDGGQPVASVQPLDTLLNQSVYARPKFNLLLFAVFAGLGLTLALLGVYGVISTTVSQQTREIGIRIALGASLSQVVGMVLRIGVKLLALGVAIGLAGSLASVRVLSGLVRVSTFDPYSFAAVAVVLFAAGLFASFWPARRAARVDPVTALRDE